MGTCYAVCRPICTSAAMHIIYTEFLEGEDFSLVMHTQNMLTIALMNRERKCVFDGFNKAKVAVKIQEVPLLYMTP